MIGLYMKIPFHSQLRKSDAKLAAELEALAAEAAEAFGARLFPCDESFFLAFDDSARPCRLRAAEASRFLSARLKVLSARLHGWDLILESAAGGQKSGAEELLALAERHWFRIDGDGLFLGPVILPLLAPYFRTDTGSGGACRRVLAAPYATAALPAEGSVPPVEERIVDRIVDEIGELVIGEGRARSIAVLGPGASPQTHLEAALSRLYKEDSASFLRIRAPGAESFPYGPVAESLAGLLRPGDRRPGPAELLSGAERGLLEELGPLLDFLRRSPYRSGYSRTFGIRLRLRAQAALCFYARERRYRSLPALVLLHGIDRFPQESLSLLSELLVGKLAEEGLAILISGACLPEAWPLSGLRRATVPAAGAFTLAKAAREAAEALGAPERAGELGAVAEGDPFRLRLAQRLASSGLPLEAGLATPLLVAKALGSFPQEYAELFLALRLCEGVLGEAETEDFLDSIGLVAGIRPLIYSALAEIGLVEAASRPKLVSGEAAREAESALADGGSAILRAFSARLLALYQKRALLPSTALYRRIASGLSRDWGRLGHLRLLLDCLSADVAYGGVEAAAPSLGPQLSIGGFLAAYAVRDRDRSLAILADLESSAEELASPSAASAAEGAEAAVLRGAVSLARAAFDYADRKASAASAKAKSALMTLHAQAVPAAEARAHRILGLCALAQEQIQEGSDYLANAFELASSLPDPLESLLSAQAEAAAHFLLGDFRRSRQRARIAGSWAAQAFRADWEAACAFMEGRIDLELGRSAEAEESFGRVRAEARIYGREDAAARAEIWTGRAASWAGEAGRARELLERYGSDAEALWFLAELEAWEGSPATAAALAERALGCLPPRDFPSADAFSWRSGFESIEERGVGFCAERSYLEDQVLAFRDYAAGLAEPAAEAAGRAERLAMRAREERLAANHPAAHLYLFYRYLLLERSSPASMDGTTALSKAFKALQLRSTRMDEAAVKDSFMDGNRWNRELLVRAKSQKLL